MFYSGQKGRVTTRDTRMTESSKKAFSLNKIMTVAFLTVLVSAHSVVTWSMQSGFARKTLIVAATEGSSTVMVHYIDVGQGDSILIDTPDKDVLIDGGPADAGPTVLSYLTSTSVTHVHVMVATHVHEDHIGGLVAILSSTTIVDEILINGQTSSSNTYTNVMNLAQSHKVTVADRGQTYTLTATANLTVFNPTQPLQFIDPNHVNDNSVVVKLQVGNSSFLFTGDAETQAEQSMLNAGLNLQSNVLKVGHHGSRTATTQTFLNKVAPSYAIISAGRNNSYGHPHSETIQRLLAKGTMIYGTFQSGTIVASTDGTSIVFQNSPQPIPEFQSSLILTVLMTVTILAVTSCRRKHAF